MRKIAFGRLRILPHDFYSMDIDDAYLMYQGWGDGLLYEIQLARKITGIISEVVNRSFGGKGIKIHKVWPLPGDDGKSLKNMDKKLDKLKLFRELDLAKGLKHGRGKT